MRKNPTWVTSSLPVALAGRHRNAVFVETGTLVGAGIVTALRAGFPRIVSIELHRPYYEVQRRRFAGYPGVTCLLGDSVEVLPGVLDQLSEPATFWLDAHAHDMHGGGRGPKSSPILDELALISQHPAKTHTILIDDRRVMGAAFIADSGDLWGGVRECDVLSALHNINPAYVISYEDSTYVLQDIIVAAPP